jgi:sugar phosphate isomerase/epimerase
VNALQVAATLYTLRAFCTTPRALAGTLARVRTIGYSAVQISGICELPAPELRRMLHAEGLVCCATHERPDVILDEPNAVVDTLNALGCRYTAYPYPAGIRLDRLADVMAFAARLNAAGRVLHDAGLVLAYHNHSIEFRRIDGRLILDVIYEQTDPRFLQGEVDTYWVQHGGGDPVAWCRRLDGRLPLLHMKDYAVSPDNQPAFAEIGGGNLDWPAIVETAERSGCEWFIVEQDECAGDPFDSLAASFDYVGEHVASP